MAKADVDAGECVLSIVERLPCCDFSQATLKNVTEVMDVRTALPVRLSGPRIANHVSVSHNEQMPLLTRVREEVDSPILAFGEDLANLLDQG